MTQPNPTITYLDPTISQLDQLLGHSCDMVLLRLYALLALTKGRETTLEDVHEAWALWKHWTGNRHHRSLIPFADLTVEVQELDRPFMEAIHAVAA